LYVIPIQRFFMKRIVALLPSSLNDPTRNCWYNLLVQDNLYKNVEWYSKFDKWTHRIVWSSRKDRRPTNCNKWTIDNWVFKGNNSNSIADYCLIWQVPDAFLNVWNDIKLNIAVFFTGDDSKNTRFFFWLANSNGDIINMNEIWKYEGQDNIWKWFASEDLNIW
jgi:hypothetical protein